MTSSANNRGFSRMGVDPTVSGLVDGTDFPHSALFHALNIATQGSYAIIEGNNFDITQSDSSGKTQFSVAAGKVVRNGALQAAVSTANFTQGTPAAFEEPTSGFAYYLLVVNSSNALELKNNGGTIITDTVPNPATTDIPIAVLRLGKGETTTQRHVQFLTTTKTANSLSIARDNSGVYTESGTIKSNAGDVEIESLEQDKNIIVKVNDGGSSTEVLRIDGATSNVGIGTSSPSEKLHVKGNILIEDPSSTGSSDQLLEVKSGSSSTADNSIILISADTDLKLPRIHIRDVEANSGTFDGNHSAYMALDRASAIVGGSAQNDLLIANGNYNKNIHLCTNPSSDGTQAQAKMTIAADGDVGIGTTNPSEKLDVQGNIRSSGDIIADGLQYSQFINLTENLAVGWYSIALIEGQSGGSGSGTGAQDQRGIGSFLVRNTYSSRHQTTMLTASHLFGGGNANGISVEHSSYFSIIGITQFRLKEASTYDGAALQIYIADASNDIEIYLKNNFQESGWQLIQAVADGTDPSTASLGVGYNASWASFGAANTTEITPIAQLGQHIQGLLTVKNIRTTNEIEINGDLDHDGSNVGFFGIAPASRQAVANLVATPITPSTGEPTAADFNATATAVGNLETKLNAILDALRLYGLIS